MNQHQQALVAQAEQAARVVRQVRESMTRALASRVIDDGTFALLAGVLDVAGYAMDHAATAVRASAAHLTPRDLLEASEAAVRA